MDFQNALAKAEITYCKYRKTSHSSYIGLVTDKYQRLLNSIKNKDNLSETDNIELNKMVEELT